MSMERPLPKFGEWDVTDPTSAEDFSIIFNKARNEKKSGGQIDSPTKPVSSLKHDAELGKPHSNPKEAMDFKYRVLQKHPKYSKRLELY